MSGALGGLLFVFVRIRKSKDGRADFSGHTAATMKIDLCLEPEGHYLLNKCVQE